MAEARISLRAGAVPLAAVVRWPPFPGRSGGSGCSGGAGSLRVDPLGAESGDRDGAGDGRCRDLGAREARPAFLSAAGVAFPAGDDQRGEGDPAGHVGEPREFRW